MWLERSLLLFGEEKLALLRGANILIVGLGGVGAYAAEMIARYAPSTENNTQAYIRAVEQISGIPATEPLDTLHAESMMPIVSAISRVENGVCASPAEVMQGWKMFADDYSSSAS